MAYRTASYDKSYVGSSPKGLKSDNLRKRGPRSVELATASVFRTALACGLNRREAAELVAATLAAGVAAAQSPIAHAVVEEECRQMTRTMVLTVRARNARGDIRDRALEKEEFRL